VISIERVVPGDPRLADYANVPDPELVRRRGLFVAEGRLVVRRLIEDGRYRLRSLLVSEAALRALEPSIARLDASVPVFVCDAREFLAISGFNIHRGCLAMVERPELLPFAVVATSASRLVVLEAVANPDNLGGVFRSAAAFGFDAVVLSPACCDPLYRKAIRTSMAATLRVPYATAEPWPAAIHELRRLGFSLVALTPREPALPLDTFAPQSSARVAILIGTEGAGLTADAERYADLRVRIPIRPDVDSLNLAVAASIAMHAISSTAP
jgi:tRNA G18 (ribose-2'-O)-methylase SpoU